MKNLRKDISTLQGNERRRFFWCFKTIGILPPPPAFNTWSYQTIAGVQQYPTSLHDVLIASHANSCEHGCFYFPAYHRNLTVLAELFINYADEVLTNRVIPAQYNSSQFQPYWNAVFDEYATIRAGQPAKVPFHYWNPTNYQNPDSIKYPPELVRKTDGDRNIDQLFNQVMSSYPWAIYPPSRLYNRNQFVDKNSFINYVIRSDDNSWHLFYTGTDADADQIPQQYNDLVTNGMANTRKSNPQKTMNTLYNFRGGIQGIDTLLTKIIGKRNYNDYSQSDVNAVKTSNLTDDEVLVIFNSQAKNLQYLSSSQAKPLKRKKTLTKNDVNFFNSLAPHYSLANAIYAEQNSAFQTYSMAQNGLPTPHDMMHIYNGMFMMHGTYSITSLLFFLYHSWIDAAFEIRVRTDQSQSSNIQQWMFSQLNASGSQQLQNVIGITNFWQQSRDQLKNKPTNPVASDQFDQYFPVGAYPIISWMDTSYPDSPNVDIHSYANAYDYYLTSNLELRRSYQMTELYSKGFYNAVQNGFLQFKGLANYDYDYNYEYLSGTDSKSYLDPNETGNNIPLYLQQIVSSLPTPGPLAGNVQGTQPQEDEEEEEQDEVIGIPASESVEKVAQPPKKQSAPFKSKKTAVIEKIAQSIPNSQEPDYYNDLLKKSVAVLVRHSSTIISGIYHLGIKLKNSEYIKPFISKKNLPYFEKIEKEGLPLHVYPIFAKGSSAKQCCKCKNQKYNIVDVGSDLINTFPELWRQIGKYALSKSQIVASTKKHEANSYTQILQAYASGPLEASLLTGAEQVYFETAYKGIRKGTIRVEADSKSVLKDEVVTTTSHINYNLTKGFDFYKLWDSSIKKSEIDSFVYKKIRIIVTIGGQVKSLHFSIPNYHKFVRYIISIEDSNGKDFEIEVADADYEFKQQYLERYCEARQ